MTAPVSVLSAETVYFKSIMKRRSIPLALLSLMVLLPDAAAQGGNGNGQGNGGQANENREGSGDTSVDDSAGEQPSEPSAPSVPEAPPVAVTEEPELSESEALEAMQTGTAVPLQSILPDVESRTGGQIINAHLREVDGALLYAVTVLTPEGKVTTEYYHAQSGLHVE